MAVRWGLVFVGWFGLVGLTFLGTVGDPPGRWAVPPPEAVARAERTIKDLFKGQYARREPAEQAALAARLLQEAEKSQADPVLHYTLLREARDLAALAGSVRLALDACEAMARTYDVSGPRIKTTALTTAAAAASEVAAKLAADAAFPIAAEAVAAGQEDLALEALDVARKSRFPEQATRAAAWARTVLALRQDHQAADRADRRLAEQPDDPDANLTAGRYRCRARGDFAAGAALLAKGGDPGLQSLAEGEAAHPEEANAEVAVGDAWWDWAAREDELVKARLQQRARWWYEQALARLTGLTRTRVEQRLHDMDRLAATALGVKPPAAVAVRPAAPAPAPAPEEKKAEDAEPKLELKPGLIAELYNDTKFAVRVKARIDPVIDFNWGKGSPDPAINHDNFGIRWTGYLKAPAGKYTLVLISDNGSRLTLDGNVLIDKLSTNGQHHLVAQADLTGKPQALQVEFLEGILTAWCHFKWIPPGGTAEQVVPARHLFHDKQQEKQVLAR